LNKTKISILVIVLCMCTPIHVSTHFTTFQDHCTLLPVKRKRVLFL